MQPPKSMGAISFLFIALMLAFSMDSFGEVLEGATDTPISGVDDSAGAMWSMFKGPLLGVIGLVVLIGGIAGAAAGGAGNRGGGAIAGALAGIAIVALVLYSPKIITTMYTASGAGGSPLSGWLPIAPGGFPVATATALSYLAGVKLCRRKRS